MTEAHETHATQNILFDMAGVPQATPVRLFYILSLLSKSILLLPYFLEIFYFAKKILLSSGTFGGNCGTRALRYQL